MQVSHPFMSLCPVILAGGGGTRLWPLSREHYPKQFLSLLGNYSLLQETLLRLAGLDKEITLTSPLVVCNEEHRFLVAEQAEETGIKIQTIILEPEGRNTAPALTVSAIHLLQKGDDPVMIMMPADHNIADTGKFQNAVNAGYQLALENYLVTFGTRPKYAETGYGYIQYDGKIDSASNENVYRIAGFKEKPDKALADSYLVAGNYLWNSGIFMMKASVWCDVIMRLHPDIQAACHESHIKGKTDNQFFRLDKQAFTACRNKSIDYAVMEKLTHEDTSRTAVVVLDAGWSDVGAWSAIWELGNRDADNNVCAGDVILTDSSNNLIRSEYRLVTAVGCNNMVIIETADAIMVADKDKSQDIKKIVDSLKSEQRKERLTHRRVYRPWGNYETIDYGEYFQVKRLTVNPGKKLSLQSHNRRAEHWVVVKGTATVTRGGEIFQLQKNESAYIPVGTKHRLENATDELLEIIEVQSGDYLGEDDIMRYEDDFGRK
ncbi:MAG: mannose-1-phosphate guanylyltransferase/mannose-6-phosphate isomerase [Gammaproteobacteria bacterium RIFCSPLOWO2_12_FULL_47_76]|nr:MAG: mannose-1-phosphate guanylyltransferase/mannose-6-phosphate isomerase [Gammaproteobacteria bacterium RIFCSPLOWO2_12_FULL_47_76]